MQVLPTFAVLWVHALLANIVHVPALQFNPMLLLHGEQELVMPSGGVATAGTITTRGRITRVYDKGSGAVVCVEAASTDAAGSLVAVQRYVFARLRRECPRMQALKAMVAKAHGHVRMPCARVFELNANAFRSNARVQVIIVYSWCRRL
ncbi:hypothetical protein EON66_07315 [archaeon]|nr:MAG: hypothetical protein EON66_07315 [archaeon]